MNESFPSPESNKVERQQVVEAYKKFIQNGITSPDDLDLMDPDVIEAHSLYEKYFSQQRELAKDNPEEEAKVNFEQTMFYLDAGFTDPEYAEETLLEFAWQDFETAEDVYPELANQIKTKAKDYITKLLPGVDPDFFEQKEE